MERGENPTIPSWNMRGILRNSWLGILSAGDVSALLPAGWGTKGSCIWEQNAVTPSLLAAGTRGQARAGTRARGGHRVGSVRCHSSIVPAGKGRKREKVGIIDQGCGGSALLRDGGVGMSRCWVCGEDGEREMGIFWDVGCSGHPSRDVENPLGIQSWS